MNDFDQAARYAVRHLDCTGFFRWLLGTRFSEAWVYRRWLDTQSVPFPGSSDLRCDTVAAFERVAQDHPPLAVVVEFMSRTRTPTLRRLTLYCLQVQTDCPYQTDPRVEYSIIGALVNLTGGTQSDRLTETPPDTGGLGLRGKFKVATLATMDARRLLKQIRTQKQARSVLVWIPLMRGAEDSKLIAAWRQELLLEPDLRIRGDIAGLALVFSELVDRRTIWKQGLEGIDVERSKVVQEWEQRGEQRGEQRARRSMLLELLESKWDGNSLPNDIRRMVETQESTEILAQWFHLALQADITLEQLRGRFAELLVSRN